MQTANGDKRVVRESDQRQELINLEAGDTFANDYRANDSTMLNELVGIIAIPAPTFTLRVNASADVGRRYSLAARPWLLQRRHGHGRPGRGRRTASLALPVSCGSGPCEWFAAENGRYGGGNQAKPTFLSASLTDQWKPTSQLLFNLGMRFDSFRYKLSDTGGAARNFWFNAFNNSYCVLPGAGQVPFYNGANDAGVNQACPTVNGVQAWRRP